MYDNMYNNIFSPAHAWYHVLHCFEKDIKAFKNTWPVSH